MIEIHFSWYVENLNLFLSQKSQFDLVKKIKKIKIKIARAHHFFNFQRTGKKTFLCGLREMGTSHVMLRICSMKWNLYDKMYLISAFSPWPKTYEFHFISLEILKWGIQMGHACLGIAYHFRNFSSGESGEFFDWWQKFRPKNSFAPWKFRPIRYVVW